MEREGWEAFAENPQEGVTIYGVHFHPCTQLAIDNSQSESQFWQRTSCTEAPTTKLACLKTIIARFSLVCVRRTL